MFCISCGQNVADGSAYCKHCGMELPRETKREFAAETPEFCAACGAKAGGRAYCAACGAALTVFTAAGAAGGLRSVFGL